jgi:hypothetical protein
VTICIAGVFASPLLTAGTSQLLSQSITLFYFFCGNHKINNK